MLTGYKTYIGAIVYAIGSGLEVLGLPDIGSSVRELGTAIMVIGGAAKINRAIK